MPLTPGLRLAEREEGKLESRPGQGLMWENAQADGALLVFAGQQRSIAEMYCALFCGAPVLPSGAAFTALGLAAADDQLGELGWPASILDATQRCRAAALVHPAEAFGVWPGEPH